MLFAPARYWRGTTKRLIRISPQGIEGFLTIHRFGHHSGRGKRSGGVSAAKFMIFRRVSFWIGPKHEKQEK